MNKEKTIVIKENSYKVQFPNVGSFVDVEFLKATLSKGMYGAMMASNTVTSSHALDMIDMEAYLTIFVPDFFKDLKCNFRELGLKDALEIKQVYKQELVPWINEWMLLFKDTKSEEVKP